jgi:hypothetical protein
MLGGIYDVAQCDKYIQYSAKVFDPRISQLSESISPEIFENIFRELSSKWERFIYSCE